MSLTNLSHSLKTSFWKRSVWKGDCPRPYRAAEWRRGFGLSDVSDIQDGFTCLVPLKYTLPETNSLPVKIGHPKMNFLFQASIFRENLAVVSWDESVGWDREIPPSNTSNSHRWRLTWNLRIVNFPGFVGRKFLDPQSCFFFFGGGPWKHTPIHLWI